MSVWWMESSDDSLQQPPLGQKKVGILKRWHCREVKTRMNVWAVLHKNVCSREVAIQAI